MKPHLLKRALPLLLTTLCICVALSAQESQSVENIASVKLMDASTKRIIASAVVEVHSNNGIICRKAPCPNNSMTWKGVSGADGLTRIPSCVIQDSTTIIVAGYRRASFNKTATKNADRTFIIELSPDTSTPPQK